MTGYTKATANSAIATGDSLNAAIGKLEFALDGKLGVDATAEKANKDSVGNEINSTYIKNITASGKTVTFTKGDGSTGTFTTQDTTYGAATSSALGLVKTGSNITNTSGTISLTKANVTNALGYTPPTSDTTYDVMTGATANAAGTSGLVPVPAKGKQASFLRGDGTWVVPTNTWTAFKGATASAAGTAGYVPAPAAGDQAKFFRADGTWVVPTNTTYSAGTGISLSGTTFTNAGVRSVAAGSSANKISVNTNGTTSTITINNVANATAASSATKATQDSAGQQINTTYIKGLSVSGTTITYTKGDGSTGTITTQDTNTDTKVTNTLATTTKAYVTGTTNASTNTGTQVFDTGVYLSASAGELVATKFTGALNGTAAKATADASGNNIISTYAKKTDVPSVWDSEGHLVSPAGWTIWITNEKA